MRTIFDTTARGELLERIDRLTETSAALWGRMNAGQMLRHCAMWDEMIFENRRYPRPLIGRLLGPLLLKGELKEKPLKPNLPTIPELMPEDSSPDFDGLKKRWRKLLETYQEYDFPDYSFVHPFFGKMRRAEVGIFAWKHSDHHLRQFGC